MSVPRLSPARWLCLALAAAALAAPQAAAGADAAPGGDTISIRPATVSIRVAAGEVTLQTVYFTNRSGATKHFVVERSDYQLDPSDSKSLQFLKSESTPDSVQPMLDVTPSKFELKSGETQELLVRIRPADTTKNGEYKGALFVGEQQASGGDSSIQVVGRVGTIIGVTVTDGHSPVGAASPADNQPSALVIAAISIAALFFLGIGLAAARKAREQEAKLY